MPSLSFVWNMCSDATSSPHLPAWSSEMSQKDCQEGYGQAATLACMERLLGYMHWKNAFWELSKRDSCLLATHCYSCKTCILQKKRARAAQVRAICAAMHMRNTRLRVQELSRAPFGNFVLSRSLTLRNPRVLRAQAQCMLHYANPLQSVRIHGEITLASILASQQDTSCGLNTQACGMLSS
jgi:hypothetical protein